ncbi:MAG: NAD(P)H-dependent glycerol-3-phosphate dehydrogenase [Proteobacteria bacterium]|nr:NAD(P)H-dependent glycerol-3-phosphate dehydrogenase [Pseudomonadota bacterium]
MKVGIIGAGAWGTALAILSAKSGNEVVLWAFDATDAKNMQKGRENVYLPGIKIPKKVTVTDKMADLRGTDAWLIVTPAEFFRKTMQKGRLFWKNQPIIICTKGMEISGKFMSEVLSEELPIEKDQIGVLSGPQFAGEVARGEPTGSTIAGSKKIIEVGRKALSGLTLEETSDVIGTEICGTGKNAVAILLGYVDANGVGENERALRLTNAWGEIVRFGRSVGAKTDTFLGLCGLGDLFLTATSKTSRNYSAGVALAAGVRPTGTVEGISAIRGLSVIAKQHQIKMPSLEFLAKLV